MALVRGILPSFHFDLAMFRMYVAPKVFVRPIVEWRVICVKMSYSYSAGAADVDWWAGSSSGKSLKLFQELKHFSQRIARGKNV